MRIVAAGASGMIGQPLVRWWRGAGHDVVTLVRRAPTAPGEVQWDPASGRLDPAPQPRRVIGHSGCDPPVTCLRWSTAVRRRLVSAHTVIGVDAACRNRLAAPLGGPSGRTGRRTRRQRAVARGSRLARLAALGLLGVLTLTGCEMPNNEFWRFGWPEGITE